MNNLENDFKNMQINLDDLNHFPPLNNAADMSLNMDDEKMKGLEEVKDFVRIEKEKERQTKNTEIFKSLENIVCKKKNICPNYFKNDPLTNWCNDINCNFSHYLQDFSPELCNGSQCFDYYCQKQHEDENILSVIFRLKKMAGLKHFPFNAEDKHMLDIQNAENINKILDSLLYDMQNNNSIPLDKRTILMEYYPVEYADFLYRESSSNIEISYKDKKFLSEKFPLIHSKIISNNLQNNFNNMVCV